MSEKAGAPDQSDSQLYADVKLLTAFMQEQGWSLKRMITTCMAAATTPGIALFQACTPEESAGLLNFFIGHLQALASAWQLGSRFESDPTTKIH